VELKIPTIFGARFGSAKTETNNQIALQGFLLGEAPSYFYGYWMLGVPKTEQRTGVSLHLFGNPTYRESA
jgi:hypothetical protein